MIPGGIRCFGESAIALDIKRGAEGHLCLPPHLSPFSLLFTARWLGSSNYRAVNTFFVPLAANAQTNPFYNQVNTEAQDRTFYASNMAFLILKSPLSELNGYSGSANMSLAISYAIHLMNEACIISWNSTKFVDLVPSDIHVLHL